MIMNFNTAPAAPAPAAPAAPAPATAPSQAAALPGAPAYGGTGAAPSALPLFAQVLDVTGVATADADTPAPAKDGDTDSPADSGLPAMAAPVIGLPVTMPPADAAAAEARAYAQAQVQTQAQTQVQANVAQANPALNISLHPAAITLNAPATAPAPSRDTREPLAAANPATPAKGGAPAQPFESLLQQSAPATAVAAPAVAAVAAREGERGAVAPATPNLGLTGAIGNTATAAPAGDTIKLNGPAQQWQEPLREALGERLQTQIGRNSEHATIRLDPPMLGRIEISIRHTAGALQVNVTASNSEVLRQLQGIGENMRSDLAQRQYTDVAVNISATPRSPAAQAFAEGDARGQRQPGRQHDDAEPGRALSDGSTAATTYAMHERETA
ncbi:MULTISPECIES: flagellar hook-length control protein FliK [unclassified Janthinobacterium]|uniref:flagellar hook-length control protein FliK n=1 Tax=unclassified Janthinobacterium TaxID=2610881 RepID=UPI001E461FE9|nr:MULTISPECIES: flagellar hook-length control protein FliK [unclassified Janthinobacterium]MCC7645488.1 flagellar hook-length control protein FliK [Janthinobacterium sp. EB271-G4-3-1]MCC7689576.1 flagellar hook-length control protein FliK [Janthinobacterium sp. EB271-G4-3-2]